MRVYRLKKFVECLSVVKVHVNGVQIASLKNGEDVMIPVEPDSEIELDLQSPAYHNYYRVKITGLSLIEIGFPFLGASSPYGSNNLKIYKTVNCHILETNQEMTTLLKMDVKMSFWFIGILLVAYLALLLAQCLFRIQL